jgi:hypothetical protein
MATRERDLYDRDFYAWTQDQAAALRRLAAERWNGPLDLAQLAEEVEDLGKAERNALFSRIERLIEHFLKLGYASASRPRRQWIVSVDAARRGLERHLTPTLLKDLETALPDLYRRERNRTARKLLLFDDPTAANALPETCPYSLEQFLDEDWLPDGRQGSADRA